MKTKNNEPKNHDIETKAENASWAKGDLKHARNDNLSNLIPRPDKTENKDVDSKKEDKKPRANPFWE